MANGKLGKVVTIQNSFQVVYAAPNDIDFATVNIRCVNTGSAEATVSLYVADTASPSSLDLIDYNVKVPPQGGLLTNDCMILSKNENVIVISDQAGVSVRVSGIEERLT